MRKPSPNNSPADVSSWTPSCGFHPRTFSEGTTEESIYYIVVVSVFLLFCTVLSFTWGPSCILCVCVWAIVYQEFCEILCLFWSISILSWLYFSRSALFTPTFPFRFQTASISTRILPEVIQRGQSWLMITKNLKSRWGAKKCWENFWGSLKTWLSTNL